MALNGSGPISLGGATSGQSIALELGQSATGQISLNDTNVRTLAGVASGAIIMPTNFWGKANRVTINLTISSNTQNFNIYNNLWYYGYVAGKSDVILTINSGVVVGSSSTGSYALDTGTGWTSGDTIKIINNGYIVGRGGNGGVGNADYNTSAPGTAGGPALRFQFATSVQNNSIIGGGGGGGGSGLQDYYGGTGGAGAGNSVGTGLGSPTTTNGGSTPTYNGTPGRAGGAAGQNGESGNNSNFYWPGTSGGGGGGIGGAGGNGWGSTYFGAAGAGGAAGACTNGAGTYATWLATGSRYGTIG